MNKILPLFLAALTSISIAAPLTDTDIKNLKKRTIKEHILFESYLETDKGLASVFGYQFDTYFNKNQCFILAISGAVGGERGGYGFAAFGLGHQHPLNQIFSLNIRGLIGSGGGGGLDAGGGFMLEGHIGLITHISPSFGIEINTGYLTYPTGTFETMMVNLGIQLTEESIFLPWN
tara:strand:- start:70 stop:597 length:528 start_codon:yes stop_codon:yes gene_type:complete